MNEQLVKQIGTRLESANRLLVISHLRPDGDAVGSLLGLGHVLQSAGKEVNLVLEDGVPKSFHHLAGVDQVYREAAGVYDLVIVLDSSDVSRIGEVLDEYGQPDLNIDHHPTNTQFGRINLVETGAVATAEILYELIRELELPLNQPAAEALLTGLITDSLGFRTNNTTPKSFRTAAALQELGADPSYLHWKALLERPLEAVLYWGQGLSKVQKEDRLVWTTLTLEDREKVGYPGRDDADLVNVLSTISETDVCVIFIEQKDGSTKISWRAQEGFDVAEVALKFGGGGHKPAAGATVQGDLEQIAADVLDETRKILT
jgi:phosphoesterase RecJ-like protein